MATPTSKRTTSPAFQFYPKDFLTSPKVRKMSMTERGVYITLLALCWLDGSLPPDLDELASECRVPVKQFRRMWESGQLHHCFDARADGRLINPRLEKERKAQRDFRDSQKRKAEQRWQRPGNAGHGNAAALPVQSLSGTAAIGNALRSPISDLQSASPKEEKSPPAPIIGKRRLNVAFEGPRVYVPESVHRKFLGLRNHPGAESELQAWYLRVSDEWFDGRRKAESPGANMLAFWDARYDEEWPPTATVKAAASKAPAWVQRARQSAQEPV